MTEPIYIPTDAERTFATDWHGGQGSMLYAVASTGALSRGTVRPYGTETDDEWDDWLRFRLRAELGTIGHDKAVPTSVRVAALRWIERIDNGREH